MSFSFWKLSTMSNPTLTATLLVGKYEFDSSENVDEYLASLECGLIVRKVYSVSRPTLAIHFNSDSEKWKLKMESIFHTYELEFKLDELVECDETYDIRKCQTIVTNESDGMLLMKQTPEEGPPVITRIQKLPTDSVKLVMECDGKTASQIFKVGNGDQDAQSLDEVEDITNGNSFETLSD